jgi:hypothetical protein
VGVSDAGLDVQCGQGVLRILQLQRSGHQRMAVKSFLQGHPLQVGMGMDLEGDQEKGLAPPQHAQARTQASPST